MLLKVRKFLASDIFMLIMLLLACLIIITDQMVATPAYYGFTIIYGFIISAILILTDDILSVFGPILLLISFVIQYKDSYDGFIVYLWGAPIIAFAILFHFIAYRKKCKKVRIRDLELFVPMCFATAAVLLGGVGIMTFSEYTYKLNLSYMFTLGPLVILVYILLSKRIGEGQNYTEHLDERISKILTYVSIFIIFAIFEYYGEHINEFLADPDILPFQWRNNASTLLILFMPFSFYLSRKKNFAYIIVPFLDVIAFILSGSRGGLIFGLAEFAMLIIYSAVIDKKHRKVLIGITAAGALAAVAILIKFWPMFSYTIDRFTSYTENFRRIGLWKRSLVDFRANPITGRGIGYMGNRDLHPSKIGQLCWYHSSIPQVIGSFGIVGIFCFLYQFIARIEFFKKRSGNGFSTAVFWSYIGLEMMSLVNPGIFAPAYLVIITIFFVFAEQCKMPTKL